MGTDDKESAFRSRLILICSAAVVGLGLLGMLGWCLALPILASVRAEYFPLVPPAALSLVLLGAALLVCPTTPRNRFGRTFSLLAAFLVSLLSLVHLVNFFRNGVPGMRALIMNAQKNMGGALSLFDQMSPLTALNLLLAVLALLILWWRPARRQTAAVLAAVIILLAFFPAFGYLFGKPIFYGLFGGTTIPVALPAVLAFFFLGTGLILRTGPDTYPVRLFLGPSARARLLRTFLPATFLLILAYGFLTYLVYIQTKIDPAPLTAVLALVAALVAATVIFQVAQGVGGEIDRAAGERKDSLMAIKRVHDEKQLYLDIAGVMLLALNPGGQITLLNKKGCALLGYAETELLGRDWFDACLPAAMRDEVRGRFHTLLAGTDAPDDYYEYPVVTKAGAERHLSFHSALIRDESSLVTGILCSGEDITERRQADAELRANIRKLKKFLGITVQIIEQLVERRDLYTAGHQKRVANLSRAIAKYLELPDDTVQAVRLAASIHDIGKITIPAEILNKTSKLSELEFGIVKTHPQVGCDIMSDIEFPWPVSEIILQHHERVNGSGYPRGLEGEAISIEARIIGVADVVEAITSRRPHRPALGMDQAIAEITQKSGILYDADAVNACLMLFDHGYNFRM